MSESVLRLHPADPPGDLPTEDPTADEPPPIDWRGMVERAQAGDRLAFEDLVRMTARSVYARVVVQLGDVHRSEDVVQETYLSAWRRIREVREPAKFPGWLAAVTHTTLLDSVRREGRKKRSRKRADELTLLRLADEGASPDLSADDREQQAIALAALRGLPPEYREPLTLRYLAGADYDAIATQLSLSNGSLRGQLQRGMKLLRERLNHVGRP